MLLVLALLGCVGTAVDANPAGCDARALDAREVRARRIPCTSERVDGGDGRVGDWLIENALTRWVIRDAYAPLTRLNGAGGSLVDVTTSEGVDGLLELSPRVGGQHFAEVEITPWSADGIAGLELSGQLEDGQAATMRYELEADSDRLTLRGADGALLAPLAGSTLAGQTVAVSETLSLGLTGDADDHGGWITWTSAEDLEVVYGAGDAVDAAGEGTGAVLLRVADDQGRDLPATLWWDGAAWPLPAGGGRVELGEGTGAAVVSAGPTYERQDLGEITVSGTVEIDVVLRRAITADALLFELGRPSWPDRSWRDRPEDRLIAAAAAGVGYSVLVADEEVATSSAAPQTAMLHQGGSRITTDDGGVLLAWPWTADARFAAHGAVDPAGLSPLDALAAAVYGDARIVAVDAAWVRSAPAPLLWDPQPRAMALASLDDLDDWTDVLDAGLLVAPLGPLAWLEGVPADGSVVDADAAMLEGRVVAGNGPYIDLRVDGSGPGSLVTRQPLLAVRVRVEAPDWMPLTEARLVTTGGRELARWPLEDRGPVRLDRTVLVAPGDWIIATVAGDEAAPPLLEAPAWAVTAPVWITPP